MIHFLNLLRRYLGIKTGVFFCLSLLWCSPVFSDISYDSSMELMGDEPGQYINPTAVHIDDEGFVYTFGQLKPLRGVRAFKKYNSDGEEVYSLTLEEEDPDFISLSYSIVVNSETNTVYLSGFGEGNVYKIDTEGEGLSIFISGISSPTGLELDSEGNLYVLESGTRSIKKYNQLGELLDTYTNTQLSYMKNMTFDNNGNIYVTSENGRKIYKVSPDNDVSVFANLADSPIGIEYDGHSFIYVSLYSGNKIVKYNLLGEELETFGSVGAGEEEFNRPMEISLQRDTDRLYVADKNNARIQVLHVIPDFTSPDNVSDVVVERIDSEIEFSWTLPDDDDFNSLMIRRSTNDYPIDTTDGDLVAENIVGIDYSDEISGDETYYYSIFSRDDAGNWSSGVTTNVIADTTPPDAPEVSVDKESETTITISWETLADTTVVEVYRWIEDEEELVADDIEVGD